MKVGKFRDLVGSFFGKRTTGYLVQGGMVFELGKNDVIVNYQHLVVLRRLVDTINVYQSDAAAALEAIAKETGIDQLKAG